MKLANISVHIDAEHTCGHMHETIFHVKDPKFEAHASTEPIVFGPVRSDEFTLPTTPKTKSSLEPSGGLGGIEVTTCMCHLSRMARLKHRIVTCLRSLFRQTKEQE